MATKAGSRSAMVERLRRELAEGHRAEHFYVTLLGLRTFDTAALHARVEGGFSYEAMERLRAVLDVSAVRMGELVRIPARTLARRKETGRLQADESDRLLRLSRIVGLSLELFEGDEAATRRWLLDPQDALSGQAPVEFASTEVGAREVENLIGRLEQGIPL